MDVKRGKFSLYRLTGWSLSVLLLAALFTVLHLSFSNHHRLGEASPGYGAVAARGTVNTGRDHRSVSGKEIYYRDRLLVLMYHNVNPVLTGDGTITPQRFQQEILFLKQKGFNFVSMRQAACFLDNKGNLPPNAVLITFDDGYEGVYRYVLPYLRQDRIPAVVFIIEGDMGTRQGMLTWPEVKELDRSGLVAIGGHTFNQHFKLWERSGGLVPATVARIDPQSGRTESLEQYDRRIYQDCLKAQAVLAARLGHTTPYFAYPYGAYSPELVRILRRAGYRYIFTVLKGCNSRGQDPLHIYRINAGSPWVSDERLYLTMRSVLLASKIASRVPESWVHS